MILWYMYVSLFCNPFCVFMSVCPCFLYFFMSYSAFAKMYTMYIVQIKRFQFNSWANHRLCILASANERPITDLLGSGFCKRAGVVDCRSWLGLCLICYSALQVQTSRACCLTFLRSVRCQKLEAGVLHSKSPRQQHPLLSNTFRSARWGVARQGFYCIWGDHLVVMKHVV